MFTDGNKRLGKFIKKDSKLFKYINIKSFSFEKLLEASKFFFDNKNKNILHVPLHSETDLHNIIKQHKTFDKVLETPDGPRPIIQPLNFTEEWKRKNSKTRHRNSLYYDYDEDIEDDLQSFLQNDQPSKSTINRNDENEIKVTPEDASLNVNHKNDNIQNTNNTTDGLKDGLNQFRVSALNVKQDINSNSYNNQVNDEQNFYAIQKQNLDNLAHTINNASKNLASNIINNKNPFKLNKTDAIQHDSESTQSTSHTEDDISNIPNFASSDTTDNIDNNLEHSSAEEYRSDDSSIQSKSNMAKTNEILDADNNASESEISESNTDISNDAKTTLVEIVQEAKNLVYQLQDLKKHILNNVQNNFYEIAQAIAEGLLKREFSINPKSFAEFLRKAIDENVSGDDIKILVHPSYYNKLIKLSGVEDLKALLVSDNSVEEGSFKIDANFKTIDGSLKTLISNLFSKADTKLFEEEDEISQSDDNTIQKVG